MPQSPPVPRQRGRALLAMAAACAITAAAGAAVAGPALEYGPEAEAIFLQRCEISTGMSAAECRRLSERLQSVLGYEAFLSQADRGLDAFRFADGCAGADASRPACEPRTLALSDR